MKVVLIILLSFFIAGCNNPKNPVNTNDTGIIDVQNQNDVTVIKNNLEVYSDVYLKDIIQINNANVIVLNSDELIDTNELGNKEIVLKYELDNEEYSYKFNINVLDTEIPRVLGGVNKTVSLNYQGDLCNLITYGDNYTGNVKCEISGDYDLNKVGTYKLNYKLSDSSNNIKEVSVTLNVIKPGTSSGNTSKPTVTYFKDIIDTYKNSNTEIGIDISRWQEDVDFEKVKAAGATFVIMRLGIQSDPSATISEDVYFQKYYEGAKKAGLKVGAYVFTNAKSREDAINDAKWTIETLKGKTLDLPIAFDWENWSKWNSFKISFHTINDVANTFMKTLKDNGYDSMLYSSKSYLESIWENKLNYPVWLAHYTNNAVKTNYTGDYVFWQLCNDGKIDGINGSVDINVWYK